ncbi:MAG: laccase domain-containing protein [Actinomycetota bacterium]|nr:laccase domain-containing protein [Actinomycetota bacterium]
MTTGVVPPLALRAGDDTVHILCSTVADGDFHIEADRVALLHRRAAFTPGRWSQLDEVHGTSVLTVHRPGDHDFEVGDALVTRTRGAVLAVWVGDCAPVAMVGAGGAVAAAHAGWRGALDGVLQATVQAMADDRVTAVLGPCIHPCCYEFGVAELDAMVARFGPHVAGRTAWGTPALDMRAAVRAALAEVDVGLVDHSQCTGCHADRYYSHRRRQQHGRQVVTVCKRAAE